VPAEPEINYINDAQRAIETALAEYAPLKAHVQRMSSYLDDDLPSPLEIEGQDGDWPEIRLRPVVATINPNATSQHGSWDHAYVLEVASGRVTTDLIQRIALQAMYAISKQQAEMKVICPQIVRVFMSEMTMAIDVGGVAVGTTQWIGAGKITAQLMVPR
jgi:hypothetical protein